MKKVLMILTVIVSGYFLYLSVRSRIEIEERINQGSIIGNPL
jgi:hypothetical protein